MISNKRANRMVPIEVHLLETLDHPNIVKVLDVFENESYYQLVMEKLGCGMDLFEYIENEPKLDEPLTSYIFRQVALRFFSTTRRLDRQRSILSTFAENCPSGSEGRECDNRSEFRLQIDRLWLGCLFWREHRNFYIL